MSNKEPLYLFDTTLRDGQQTLPPCSQAQSADDRQADEGRAEAG